MLQGVDTSLRDIRTDDGRLVVGSNVGSYPVLQLVGEGVHKLNSDLPQGVEYGFHSCKVGAYADRTSALWGATAGTAITSTVRVRGPDAVSNRVGTVSAGRAIAVIVTARLWLSIEPQLASSVVARAPAPVTISYPGGSCLKEEPVVPHMRLDKGGYFSKGDDRAALPPISLQEPHCCVYVINTREDIGLSRASVGMGTHLFPDQ